jgi:hypothetical protein
MLCFVQSDGLFSVFAFRETLSPLHGAVLAADAFANVQFLAACSGVSDSLILAQQSRAISRSPALFELVNILGQDCRTIAGMVFGVSGGGTEQQTCAVECFSHSDLITGGQTEFTYCIPQSRSSRALANKTADIPPLARYSSN